MGALKHRYSSSPSNSAGISGRPVTTLWNILFDFHAIYPFKSSRSYSESYGNNPTSVSARPLCTLLWITKALCQLSITTFLANTIESNAPRILLITNCHRDMGFVLFDYSLSSRCFLLTDFYPLGCYRPLKNFNLHAEFPPKSFILVKR